MANIKNQIKIALALLLIVCLADMPYGYYQFVRVVGTAGFVYLAVAEFREKISVFPLLWLGYAVLLNPFYKLAFRKGHWSWIDGAGAALLAASLLFTNFLKRRA